MKATTMLALTGAVMLGAACAASDDAANGGAGLPDGPVPYAALGDELGVWDGTEYHPVFLKGVNLSVAVPGTLAGELAATREQYDRWLEQISALGMNVLRTYTLHYPRFYQALAAFNRSHSQPMYLMQGVWLDEDNPSHDFYDMTAQFDDGIREVIDCVHGRRSIPERKGRAFGTFDSDVSRAVMGYIIGRELIPNEVENTNRQHAGRTSYDGAAISLPSGNPVEAWLAERLDGLVLYERHQYSAERPVSVANWPTLDPLRHPSEAPTSAEDSQSVDLENLDTTNAKAGFFASYHAYPYYPDFMTRDSAYQSATDDEGPNTYLGYLDDLKRHYATHPLFIAEFGVPTSWGNAHFGAAGMNHGGENELEQGADAARLMRNISDTHCAGGAFFAWIDEWWKRTWIVDDLAYPRDRYPLWHNITSPEQNFGLISFDLTPPAFERWPSVTGEGRIREIRADADAEFFHVQLQLDRALSTAERLSIAFDTYRDDLGESVLPSGTQIGHRAEFVLVIDAPDQAQLYVTQAYDLFGIWHQLSTDAQLYHSVASDGGTWVKVRWLNNSSPSDALHSQDIDEIGAFSVRDASEHVDARDGVIVRDTTLHVRVPWTLLQFADPSTRTVIDDDRSTPDPETSASDGIALSVELGDDLLETPRFRWDRWDKAPPWTEREKASAQVLAQTLGDLP